MHPLMSVWPELWTVNCQTGKRVSGTSTACSFCDRSANVLSVSYTVHIRFVHYTSVTRRFIDQSLSVTCAVHMRTLQLPRRSSPPLLLGVSYLYPVICDSTITHVALSYSQIDIVTYVKSCWGLTAQLTECKHFYSMHLEWLYNV